MSFRPRTTASPPVLGNDTGTLTEFPTSPTPKPPTITNRTVSQTLATTANLANLLPTGTIFAFQFLVPLFTNNGLCDAATRSMTLVLLLVLAVSCFIACFTDSVKGSDGLVYYGIATPSGMFLFDCPDPAASGLTNLSKYKIRFIDYVHAILSVLVFISVALKEKNVTSCLYPSPKIETQEILSIGPVGIGLLCSLLFVIFPTKRHGIGFPITSGK